MSAKWIGIGVVVAAAAVGGYAALRPAAPAQAPAPAPIAEAPTPSTPAPTQAVQVEPELIPVAQDLPAVPRVTRTETTTPQRRPESAPRLTPPAASAPSTAAAASVAPTLTPPPVVEPPAQAEPQRYVPDPPPATQPTQAPVEPAFVELVVAKSSVIGIALDHAISTRTARLEDRVSARVSREVRVAEDVAIPEGARLEGTVVVIERGGRFRNAPRLGIRFSTLILPDNTRIAMTTDAIYREGESPTADATAKVGTGAVIGAVLGAVLGGKKGAILGGTAGAAGGAAAVANGDESEVTLKAGTTLTVRLTEDLAVLIRR